VNLVAKRILEMLKAATITRWCSKECSAFLPGILVALAKPLVLVVVNLAAKRILEMLKAATITRWCSKECSAFLLGNLGGFSEALGLEAPTFLQK
jgi:hypothetical protein